MNIYGNKYNNIKKLYNCQQLQENVPNAYPFIIEEDDKKKIEQLMKNESKGLNEILEKILNDKYYGLFDAVENELGELPWIIRSSGEEDGEENSNAGAYESYICDNKEKFNEQLAKTMLSGMNDRATEQGVFVDEKYTKQLIPVFIQRLITSENTDDIENVPFISEQNIYEMIAMLHKVHNVMELEELDTEWVLETSKGIISGTSMSIKNEDTYQFSAEIVLGFGIGTTQHCTSKKINRFFVTQNKEIKFEKNVYVEVDVKKIWIIQARKAHNIGFNKKVPILDENFKLEIEKKDTYIAFDYKEEIIVGEQFRVANAIVANTLMQAWNIYLHLSNEQRNDILYVIVKIGSKTEHAGIMFSQTKVTVLRCEIDGKIMNLRSTKCCIDFDKRKILFITKNNFDNEECYSMNNMTIKPEGYFLATKENEKNIFNCKKENGVFMPELGCVIIGESGIYSPCKLHMLAMQVLNDEDKKIKLYEEYKNSNIITKLYLQAIFCLGEEYYLCKKKYPFLKEDDVGLIWIIMMFEQGKMSDYLHNDIIRYFNNNITNERAYNFFSLLIELSKVIEYLDCFTEKEVLKIYDSLKMIISSKLNLGEKNELLNLVVEYGMSPYYIEYFFEKGQVKVELFKAYKDIVSNLSSLVIENDDSLITFKSYEIKEKYGKIKEICGDNLITNACYHSIIEKYDSDAKEIAEILTNKHSKYYYDKYIQTLELMLNFIEQNTTKNKTVDYIKKWLKEEKTQREQIYSYNLAEYELQDVLRRFENGNYNHNFENIHQVHNFLHQWALLETPVVDAEELPDRVYGLVDFCNSFSMEKSKILRFGSNILEIELPMCTHKASFVINKDGFYVEFSESPETEDNEIGRLVALDKMIDVFFDETYEIDHFYEKQLGTWTWFVYGKNNMSEQYYEKYRNFISIIRALLDSSYDFSHTPIDRIGDVKQFFCQDEWKSLIIHLLEYRQKITSADLFTELKVFSFSDFFTQIIISESNRKYFLNLYKSGFDKCIYEFEVKTESVRMNKLKGEWIEEFRKLRLIILVLVLVWHKETLKNLERINVNSVYKVLLAKNLFLRKDVQQLVENGSIICSDELMLKSVPHLLLGGEKINSYIEKIVRRVGEFKLAKQYLLYNKIHDLDNETIKKLSSELYFVPIPRNKDDEEVYERLGIDTCRLIDVEKTITTQI